MLLKHNCTILGITCSAPSIDSLEIPTLLLEDSLARVHLKTLRGQRLLLQLGSLKHFNFGEGREPLGPKSDLKRSHQR